MELSERYQKVQEHFDYVMGGKKPGWMIRKEEKCRDVSEEPRPVVEKEYALTR